MISIFDLFSIGVGPSSSHTVGPMRAAYRFVQTLDDSVQNIQVTIYGSLAQTGKGHATDKAIIMGLMGNLPETVDFKAIDREFNTVLESKQLILNQQRTIKFDFDKDFICNKTELLPYHTNGMRFNDNIYYSIGGGFIVEEGEKLADNIITDIPYPFDNAETLFMQCEKNNVSIAELIYKNECALRDENAVREGILKIAHVMRESIRIGAETEGILPGGLNVQRRAPLLMQKLLAQGKPQSFKETASLDWASMYAIAVNEENAACHRVVTAPTNGAAGVIPAVMHYLENFYPDVTEQTLIDFLLTAAAIATLYKKGASISAAEVGCQGEVGVATSMAAGALTAVLGGNLKQVENAAEIAMEHSLGLTCDPIAGLVQIPCIERNAVGAVKAIQVTRLALMETGLYKKVSLDNVIATMKRTGHDMSAMYKETSKGGLAKIRVNVIEC